MYSPWLGSFRVVEFNPKNSTVVVDKGQVLERLSVRKLKLFQGGEDCRTTTKYKKNLKI